MHNDVDSDLKLQFCELVYFFFYPTQPSYLYQVCFINEATVQLIDRTDDTGVITIFENIQVGMGNTVIGFFIYGNLIKGLYLHLDLTL